MNEPIELPDFKKREREKEKEKKRKGGGWWSWGAKKAPFDGVRVLSGAASSAARIAGEAGLGAETSVVSSLLTAKMALAVGILLVLGGAGLYWMASLRSQKSGNGEMHLGALSSLINSQRIENPDAGSLGDVARGARGQIAFEQSPNAPAPISQKQAAAPQSVNLADQSQNQTKLAVDTSESKLTSDIDSLKPAGGDFGKNDVFSNSAFKFKMDKPNIAAMGHLSAFSHSGGPAQSKSSQGAVRGFGGPNGQLGYTAGTSIKAAGTLTGPGQSQEGGKQLASNAFDQQSTGGGAGVTTGNPATPPATGSGGGGGGGAAPVMGGSPPTAPSPVNTTPYQPILDSAINMAAQAAMLKKIGTLLMIMGGVLIGIGIKLLFSPISHAWGIALIAAGAAMIAAGVMMIKSAGQLAAEAKSIASQVGSQFGQTNQQQIVNDCVNQALANGTPPSQCTPQTQAPNMTNTGADNNINRVYNEGENGLSGAGINVNNGSPVTSGNGK